MILILSFIFSSGCTRYIEVPYYVEASCPKIEVLKIVDPIEITTDNNGSISYLSIPALLNGAKKLRKSETYYYKQIVNYNEKFLKSPVDK